MLWFLQPHCVGGLGVRASLKRIGAVLLHGCVGLMIGPNLVSAEDARKNTSIVSGDCQTTAQKFVVVSKIVTSKSGGVFSTLPDSISFVQGGTAPGCVMVSFTAEAHGLTASTVQIRPLLDGQPSGLPTMISLGGATNVYDSHGMNFIFVNVAPGRHRLQIEFASTYAPASLQARTTILHYVK